MCRIAQAPFQVKPINREQVETLKTVKKGNAISNHQESWVFSLKYDNLTDLGKFIKRFQTNPDLIMDEEQFEIANGNHCFSANTEIVAENPRCPANFKVLKCKVMRRPKMKDEADVATMQQVHVARCVRHGYAYPSIHE